MRAASIRYLAFLLLSSMLAGCLDSTLVTSPHDALTESSAPVAFRPESGLDKFSVYGSFSRRSKDRLSVFLRIADSNGHEVQLRAIDKIRLRTSDWDTSTGLGQFDLRGATIGDTLRLDVVLGDSGTVLQAKLAVPPSPVLSPAMLPKDTLLQLGYDPAWRGVNLRDSVAVLDKNGAVLASMGQINQWGSSLSDDEASYGPIFFDLRPLVRESAAKGPAAGVFLRCGGSASRNFTQTAGRFRYQSLFWNDQFPQEDRWIQLSL